MSNAGFDILAGNGFLSKFSHKIKLFWCIKDNLKMCILTINFIKPYVGIEDAQYKKLY